MSYCWTFWKHYLAVDVVVEAVDVDGGAVDAVDVEAVNAVDVDAGAVETDVANVWLKEKTNGWQTAWDGLSFKTFGKHLSKNIFTYLNGKIYFVLFTDKERQQFLPIR